MIFILIGSHFSFIGLKFLFQCLKLLFCYRSIFHRIMKVKRFIRLTIVVKQIIKSLF